MRTGGRRSLLELCDKEEEEDTEANEEVRAEGKEEKPWAVREGFTQRLMRGKQTLVWPACSSDDDSV